MTNLVKAIIAVMTEVEAIDKSMQVGTGNGAYKGVADEVVKEKIGVAMRENGLVILPIGVDPKTEVSRWTDEYGKSKQSIFTEVKTKYLLMHESGESQILEGYGHGVDSQDKGAGKATTYALKYALLYTFLVPTVKIDDSDKTHSDDQESKPNKPYLNQNTPQWTEAVKFLSADGTIDKIKTKYLISKANEEKLKKEIV